ncbi:hypothetical protein [Microvirga vignae]|uniref:hypothetical protein n=1 Tax=Microvirga vignae TaxID=1225564 RepID=UPI00063FD856|nr:hypothetical protein [Microvirga vignae]
MSEPDEDPQRFSPIEDGPRRAAAGTHSSRQLRGIGDYPGGAEIGQIVFRVTNQTEIQPGSGAGPMKRAIVLDCGKHACDDVRMVVEAKIAIFNEINMSRPA